MLRNEGDPLQSVVICTPGRAYFDVADLKAQNMNEVSDPDATRKQHGYLARAMEEAGARVVDVAELADHPNSTFTRDVALCTPAGYVQLRMGLPGRRGEPAWMAEGVS